jgi:glycosyltransferase involved in cell wall biosynthesis
MRLLIVTQVVDTEDPVLGFFARWITELSQNVESIEVVCLKEGKHELPSNVHVHSLGKEKGNESRLEYSRRFLSLAWGLRDNYDAVFVHMNQEYILIAGWLWQLLGKRIYMWRNHHAGSWLTDIAAALCTQVFCTSKYSYTASYRKTRLMPVGIDTGLFVAQGERNKGSILFLARVAPSKHPDLLIEALGKLHTKGIPFTASIYGAPGPDDNVYYNQLIARTKELGIRDLVEFPGPVRNADTPAVYSAHEITVNLSSSGMFDKTIFEAAACGSLSLSCNKNLEHKVDPRLWYPEGSVDKLADKLAALLAAPDEEKEILRAEGRSLVEKKHSLAMLVRSLGEAMRPERLVLFHNGSIGDFLMFTYLAERLMQTNRFADATLYVSKNADILRPLVAAYPYLRVVPVSVPMHMPRGPKTIIVPPTPGRLPLSLKLYVWVLSVGAGNESYGFQDAGLFSRLYTHVRSYDTSKLYIDTLRDLAEDIGSPHDPNPPRLAFDAGPRTLAAYGVAPKRFVVFHPGASNPKRMFSKDDATSLVSYLRTRYPDHDVLVSGGGSERSLVESVVRAAASGRVRPLLDAPLSDIAALLQNAALYIGTDTGITHLACFVGVPVLEVAHNATANWLAWYAPQATVLYRLQGEEESHTEQEYLRIHAKRELRPFTMVPVQSVIETVGRSGGL